MGTTELLPFNLKKGEGYRVIGVKKNSPLQGLIQPFFDFILGVTPLHPPEKLPKDILNKLSPDSNKILKKSILDQINCHENREVVFNVVSTKHRNVRSIQAIPNKSWNGTNDLIGIQLRKERYDEAFDTYSQISQIVNGSPMKKAGVIEGQYLIGCLQFKYLSMNDLLQALYDRYFDKEILDKTVNFAIYNISMDDLRIVQVTLQRGWGGQGLLGCDFLHGYLYKFPTKLEQYRSSLLQTQKQKKIQQKIRQQLHECDGASRSLVEALKNNRNRQRNTQHLKEINSILSIKPPPIIKSQIYPLNIQPITPKMQQQRIQKLQIKVSQLQATLSAIKNYLDSIPMQQMSSDQQKLQQK